MRIEETSASLLPLALRAPGVLFFHAIHLATFARLTAYAFSGRGSIHETVGVGALKN